MSLNDLARGITRQTYFPSRKWLRVDISLLFMMGLLTVTIFLVVYPMGMVFYGSFWSSSPGWPGHFTAEGYKQAFEDPKTLSLIWTTVWLAAARTALSVAMAILLAWIIARTDTPFRGLLEKLLFVKFILPILPLLLGWILLASPRTGILNIVLMRLLPLKSPPLNIYSFGGIIWVSVIGWASLLAIFLLPAFRNMDASLEESSRMSGAGTFTTIWRITIPLMAPTILATVILGFVRMLESFETELFLGSGAHIWVFTTKIFDFIFNRLSAQYNSAMALAVILLSITFLLVALQWIILGKKEFTTVTGKGYHPRPIRLGRWKYVTVAFVLTWFFLAVILPLGVVVQSSFMKVAGGYDIEGGIYTLEHWRSVLSVGMFWMSVKNSLYVAVGSATIGMLLYTLVAYVVTRSSFAGRKILDLICYIPWAMPGIVLALGFVWAFMSLPITAPLYGTLWIMIMAYLTRGFPLGTRTMTSTMIQIHRELEESARVHGASWTRTFVSIWLPLLKSSLITGWIFLFVIAFKDLTVVVLLYGSKTMVLSTLFFSYWDSADLEEACVTGLIMFLITFIGCMIVLRIGKGAGEAAL
ncbi:MAG: iron ABC transporter permease [Deltaproteobacteria bacterium]|nr:iron ABC transporter permease [Deltaproteobacteria bacterium]MBW2063804.1 iron ABC transporter permease [Deltaproteobacteria bacterium]